MNKFFGIIYFNKLEYAHSIVNAFDLAVLTGNYESVCNLIEKLLRFDKSYLVCVYLNCFCAIEREFNDIAKKCIEVLEPSENSEFYVQCLRHACLYANLEMVHFFIDFIGATRGASWKSCTRRKITYLEKRFFERKIRIAYYSCNHHIKNYYKVEKRFFGKKIRMFNLTFKFACKDIAKFVSQFIGVAQN